MNCVQHTAYSLDFAPSNFHLFLGFKKWLGVLHFDTDIELRADIVEFFWKQYACWFALRIEKLINRYQKCLNLLGDYFEK